MDKKLYQIVWDGPNDPKKSPDWDNINDVEVVVRDIHLCIVEGELSTISLELCGLWGWNVHGIPEDGIHTGAGGDKTIIFSGQVINDYDINDMKALALAHFLEVGPDDITVTAYDTFEMGEQEYRVLTDSEADAAWNDDLENYIDEYIIPEMPEAYQNYFDYEKWKQDAKFGSRGRSLNHYDGSEEEIYIKHLNEWLYIYRVN